MTFLKKIFLVFIFISWFTACSISDQTEQAGDQDLPVMNKNISLVDIDALILNNPKNAELYYQRAKLLLGENAINESSKNLDKCIALDSLNSNYHTLRGDVFLQMGNLAMAKISYDRAIQIDPKDIESQIHFAEYYLGLSDYSNAIKHADIALRIDVANPKVYFMKGRVFLSAQDTSKAMSSFQTAIEMNPNYLEPYLMLGLISDLKNDSIALLYYRSALEIEPNNVNALYGKGSFEMKMNKKDEALFSFRKLTSINSSNPAPYFNIAYIQMSNDNLDSAIVYYSLALKRNPRYYQALYNRGLCYEVNGDVLAAENDFQMVLSLKPDHLLAKESITRIKQ